MLVKINNQFVRVYKDGFLYKFELTGIMEPDYSYLSMNYDCRYVGINYDQEFHIDMPQRKIRRQINKLKMN